MLPRLHPRPATCPLSDLQRTDNRLRVRDSHAALSSVLRSRAHERLITPMARMRLLLTGLSALTAVSSLSVPPPPPLPPPPPTPPPSPPSSPPRSPPEAPDRRLHARLHPRHRPRLHRRLLLLPHHRALQPGHTHAAKPSGSHHPHHPHPEGTLHRATALAHQLSLLSAADDYYLDGTQGLYYLDGTRGATKDVDIRHLARVPARADGIPSAPSPPPDVVLSHLNTHASSQRKTLMRGMAFTRVYAEGRWANGADSAACLSGWSDAKLTRTSRGLRTRGTYGLRVPASCVLYAPEAQGSLALLYVRRTRTGLRRAVRTAYRGPTGHGQPGLP